MVLANLCIVILTLVITKEVVSNMEYTGQQKIRFGQ